MYGDGLQKLEAISQNVLEDFVAYLNATGGETLHLESEIQKAVINVITSLVNIASDIY